VVERRAVDAARRPPADAVPPLPARAAAALREARTLDALKALREVEGLDLAAAKARLDAYLAANPALKKRLDERQREFRKRLIGWVLVVDAIVIAAVAAWWFSR
jgi:N-formylglutamate amidohydrolase